MQIRPRIRTDKPETKFERSLQEELSRWSFEISQVLNGGIKVADNFSVPAQNHIEDADGNLADITTKFNDLLSKLETLGLLKSS
jgi:hypothetical protein